MSDSSPDSVETMALVRNRDALARGAKPQLRSASTLASDATIAGSVEWKGGALRSVPCPGAGVRVRAKLSVAVAEAADATSIPYELASLLSLVLGCRVELARNWRACGWHNSFMARRIPYTALPHQAKRSANLDDFTRWIDRVGLLRAAQQQDLLWAAEWYRRALWEAETHFELAYLDLITAVEIVCKRRQVEPSSWETDYPCLDGLLKSTTSDATLVQEVNQVKVKLTEHSRLKRKFVAFLLEGADDDFWAGRCAAELGRDTRAGLPTRIQSVYDVRCRRLHDGYWMDESVKTSHFLKDERLRDAFWWNPKRIPTLDFFTQLVRHSLLKYATPNVDGT